MKIGLATIHYANSYGGTLQAFSSLKVLSRYGETCIIDYKSPHLEKTMKPIRLGKNLRSILWAVKDIFRLLPRRRLLKKFNAFGKHHYNLSVPCNDIDQLRKLEEEIDIFVAGSDQIWNPSVTGTFDPVYFLSFVQKKKKISFASSSGSHLFSDKEKLILKKHLERFSHISVRESDTAEVISTILNGCPVSHVLDPTLMLTKDEWMKNLDLRPPGPGNDRYIFVYTLKKDNLVKAVIKKISKQSGMKVIAIDQDPFLGYHADSHLKDADPLDFLSFLINADFVITNSFHGTTFAVNFKKPFVAVKPETGLNRIQTFLDSVGLSDRLVTTTEDIDRVSLHLDVAFEHSHERLDERRDFSFQYLENALMN